VDATGACIKCAAGFAVINGSCSQIKTCLPNQYVNVAGNCQTGNVANCQTYGSPNGECLSCKAGFGFNSAFECVATSISCPPQTATSKYVVINGKCVKTDINCVSMRDDGFCMVCLDGYYQNNGSCMVVIASAPQ
jgi:hypothetical protein